MPVVCFASDDDQGIGRVPGEEHRRDGHVAVIDHQHQERPEPGGGRSRRRVVRLGEALDDRKDDAAGAGAVGRHDQSEHHVAGDNRIAEADRRAADGANEEQRDSPPEAGLDHAAGNAEGGDHHPDERLGIAGERLAGRQRAGQRRGGHAEQRHRAERQRLEHQAENRADKDRQQPPTLDGDARRHRCEEDRRRDQQHDRPPGQDHEN